MKRHAEGDRTSLACVLRTALREIAL